jgi:PAS domain S-box-containing protein
LGAEDTPPPETSPAEEKTLHILIIEDDRDHLDLILQAFRRDPGQFRISIAASIKNAREITRRDVPDLIISDWNLPDGKGIDILDRVEGVVATPLIVMTGFGDERLAVEIMKSGAVDYIVKSATVFEDLPNISRKALRFWENLQERLRAERAQQETQKRLADILAFLPDPVLAIDNTGRVIAWNNAMEGLTGVPAADIMGKGDHEYCLPFYGERRPILIDLVRENDPEIEAKYLYFKRDGQKIVSETFIPGMCGGKGAHIWGTASPIFDAAGDVAGAIEVIRDISDRKQTEQAIQASEEKFRSLVEGVPDFILVHRNGKLIFVNQAAAESMGYPLQELIGRTMTDFVVPEDRERVIESMKQRMTGVPLEPYEIRILTASGQVRQVIVRGSLINFDGGPASLNVLTDVTEMRKGEKQLLLKNIVFESSVTANSIADNQGIITDINPAFLALWGYREKDDVVGKPVGFFLTDEKQAPLLLKTLDTSGHWSGEFIARRSDGSTFIAFGTATTIIDNEGTKIGYQSTCLDISENKQAESALQESEAKFRDLFNNMSSGVVIYEPVPGGQDFIIRDINHAAEQIEKVRKEDVVEKSVLQVFPGVVEFGLFSVFQRVALTGVAEEFPVSLYQDNRISGWRNNYVYRLASGEIVAIYEDLTEKKQAEEAVRESDERFRIVSHATNDTIWDWDFTTGRLWWSEGISSVFGYKEGEIELTIGAWECLVHPDDRERVVTGLNGMIDAGRENWSDEYRFRKADGSYADVLDRGFIIRDAAKNAIRMVGSILDITERKATERVLLDEATRRRILVDQSRDGIVTLDQDGKVFESNQRFADMLGYTPDEMKELHVWDWEAVATREQLQGMIHSVDEGGDHIETRHRRKDGSLLDVEISTNAAVFAEKKLIFCVVRDISDKKAAQRALEEREIRFRALIQNSSDIIRILDRDGKITYESDSAERILGYSAGTLIGKDPLDYIHPDDRERVKTDLQDVLMMNNPGTPTEFRIRRADGKYLWVESLGSNLMDTPGVNGVVITTRPIQQRKEAEYALRESEARLRLALEGADAGFWDWYLPSGKAVFSDRYYTMTGYKPGEYPATYEAWTDLMHPDDRKRVIPDLERQIREGDSQLEIEYRTKSKEGTWIWLLGRGKVVEKDASGIPVRVTGVNIDITNRRLMESEIRSLNTVLEQRVKDRTEALSKANEALEEENMQRLDAEEKMRVALEEKTVLLKEIHHRVKNNLQIIASLLNLQSRYIRDEATLAAIRESQNRVKAMALVHEKLYRSEEISHIDLADYIGFLGTGLFQFYDARSRGIRFVPDIKDIDVDINTAIPLGLIINELISNSLKYAFPAGKSGEVTITITLEGQKLMVTFRDNGIGIPAELDWQNTQSLGLRLVNTLVDQLNGTIELDRSSGTRFTMVLQQKP